MLARNSVFTLTKTLTHLIPFSIHAFAQALALVGSLIRIPMILLGISRLEFSNILICLQILGLSGLIFGGSRLYSRNPPERFLSSGSRVNLVELTSEILGWSGWLFCVGFLNALLFLFFLFPAGEYGFPFAFVLIILSTLLFGFSAYFGILTGILDGMNKFNGVAFSDVISTILMIPLTYLALVLNADPWTYLAIGSITLFNSGFYAIMRLRRHGIFHRIRFNSNWKLSSGISGRMGQGLGAFLSNNFDLLIIGKFGNQLDTIDYSATSRINLAVDLPSAANAPKQWLQISKLNEKDPNFTSNLRRINFRFTISNFILILPIAVMLNFFYAPYMQSLFGEKYIPNYGLLWSILLARVVYTTYSTLYVSLSTMSRTKTFTSLGILIGILNILISCLSVKLLPLIGPAIGTIVASFIGIGVILFLNRQKPYIKAST